MGTYTTKQNNRRIAISREAPQETNASGWRTGDFTVHIPIDEWSRFCAAVAAADKEVSDLLAARCQEVDEQLEGLPDVAKLRLHAAFDGVPKMYWPHLRKAINAAREGDAT